MAQRQVNIRIAEEEFDVLAAAAFLEDESPSDVVRTVLKAHLSELEADPEVTDALRAKRARGRKKQAERGAPVSSLDARRRGRGGDA